jgi:hypothetical protein
MTTPDIAGLCEKLRERAAHCKDCGGISTYDEDDCALDTEAADTLERQAAEIERLREALIERLREALTMAKGPLGSTGPTPVYEAVLAALTGEDTAGSPTSQNIEPGLAFSDAGEP